MHDRPIRYIVTFADDLSDKEFVEMYSEDEIRLNVHRKFALAICEKGIVFTELPTNKVLAIPAHRIACVEIIEDGKSTDDTTT